jgi:hypothetical protein
VKRGREDNVTDIKQAIGLAQCRVHWRGGLRLTL